MKQEVLDVALEAFWAKIAEGHPERETNVRDPGADYDLERWGQHAYESWLEVNSPVYYVQKTVTLVVKITGARSSQEALDIGKRMDDPTWFNESLDTRMDDPTWFNESLNTENEVVVLQQAGRPV